MPIPNGGLITETNRQYYAGNQQFTVAATAVNQTFTSTFDTNLVVGTGNYSDPGTIGYNLNNFKVYTSANAQTWTELTSISTDFDATALVASVAGQKNVTIVANTAILGGSIFSLVNKATGLVYGTITLVNGTSTTLTLDTDLPAGGIPTATALSVRRITTWTMVGNIVTIPQSLTLNTYVRLSLSQDALWNSHGSYEYTRLTDVIDNFLIAYVGAGKLIPSVKRTDVIFHARRGLQEFSYDTLKSIKSSELTIPASLSLTIPQDYVNYTSIGWPDNLGVLHPIYPTNNLNQSPYHTPGQDDLGNPIQDSSDSNTEVTSQMNATWAQTDPRFISGGFRNDFNNANILDRDVTDGALGQRYGMDPITSQGNGWFKIDERQGTFNFTSNLANKLILLQYISDGNAYDLDARIPKMAEEALYAHIIHAILSTTANIQEYVIRRFKQERSAKLRNAKIRLSNLKIEEITQVMRGKSKWLKF
jgi:hypothetical protein|tara:strand:+ start:775 stop:2205 length:1431 start_codon:yes stop_codon:yes gene_type:complete